MTEEIAVFIHKLGKLKYTEENIEEEMKTHPEGAAFSKGYNMGIVDAQELLSGIEKPWIDAPENPQNKKDADSR